MTAEEVGRRVGAGRIELGRPPWEVVGVDITLGAGEIGGLRWKEAVGQEGVEWTGGEGGEAGMGEGGEMREEEGEGAGERVVRGRRQGDDPSADPPKVTCAIVVAQM